MHHVPTRAELLAALDDPAPGNPLATAIAAVITSYGNALAEQVTRAGAFPNPLVLPMPQTELEAFVLEWFTEEMAVLEFASPLPRLQRNDQRPLHQESVVLA